VQRAIYDVSLREAEIVNVSSEVKDNARSLVPAWDKQDHVFSAAFSILENAIAARVFPAASIAVTHAGKLIALKALGHFTYKENDVGATFKPGVSSNGDFDVNAATLFDLASVTKIIATTTMAMILYERSLLELDAPIIGTIPEFLMDSCGESDPRRPEVTFRTLLAHSSGLPAYEKLYLQAHAKEDLLRGAFTAPLSSDPGTRAEYSDIGFIILGEALERIARSHGDDTLDAFCQREIFGPLGMAHTAFNPAEKIRNIIPPTADERQGFRKQIVQGFVQDENAFILGGVAGHAGLFSTAEDLARFAHAMMRGGVPILRPETVALFTRREATPAGTSHALGWDTPSTPSQSGKFFGPESYGHLGYTGTSLWIDPVRKLSVTLLTNRTWPDCSNQAIKQVRPAFHDAIIEVLKASLP
jgi:serine-type D-Ala-D-Ala carboxypeptidase